MFFLRGRVLAVLFLCTLVGCGAASNAPKPGQKVIGVTLLTQSHDFFKDLEEGLQEEAKKHDFHLVIQSAEFDPTTQARQLEDFVTQKVDAIVVCPCDSDTVATSLRGADQAGIPVFTADIAAKDANIVCHVASDNFQGGQLAARALAKAIGEQGDVLIIDHPTVSSVQDRTRGFESALRDYPKVRIVGKPSAEGQRSKAVAVMEDALISYPELRGVFGINDESALGALRAVEAASREVAIIGYDATPDARDAIARGTALKADVVQYPRKIGVTTIDSIARHFKGEKLEANMPVEVGVVDQAALKSK